MLRDLSRRNFIARTRNVALAGPFLGLVGCDGDAMEEAFSFGGPTMGTSYSVKLADRPDAGDRAVIEREIATILDGVNQRMSTYLPNSELSRFNRSAPGRWTTMSDETLTVIDRSRRVHLLTKGAFDPTVGPIVDLWGFGPGGGQDHVPSDLEIADAADAVGFEKIVSQDSNPVLQKQAPGVRLDLSGVAKGYAVDLVAQHLDDRGYPNYLVEVGGELRAGGKGPASRPWRVGIEKPALSSRDILQVVDLESEAMATSGNYRIFFEQEGRRYSHIIDPTSGRPVEHDLASITVVASTTLEADALSTALLVAGLEDGMAIATEHGVAAFFITGRDGDFVETASPAFLSRMA